MYYLITQLYLLTYPLTQTGINKLVDVMVSIGLRNLLCTLVLLHIKKFIYQALWQFWIINRIPKKANVKSPLGNTLFLTKKYLLVNICLVSS